MIEDIKQIDQNNSSKYKMKFSNYLIYQMQKMTIQTNLVLH